MCFETGEAETDFHDEEIVNKLPCNMNHATYEEGTIYSKIENPKEINYCLKALVCNLCKRGFVEASTKPSVKKPVFGCKNVICSNGSYLCKVAVCFSCFKQKELALIAAAADGKENINNTKRVRKPPPSKDIGVVKEL